jgi:HlyD family secretion protein
LFKLSEDVSQDTEESREEVHLKIDARRAVLLAAALAGVAGVAVTGCSQRGESKEAMAAPPNLAKVERQDLEIRAEASGQIEPIRMVEVKSKVSGELIRINFETGDEVRQGELIATVDPRDVRNALAQMEADLELARARVETAKSQRRRAEELAKGGLLSTQDLENTRLEETNANAQLVKARTNLQLAQEKMGDVTIRAPITGTIIEKGAEQGQIIASASANVSGGTTLVKMADLATVQARALVDEVDIGRIHAGQETTVEVEAYPGRAFRGSVTKIEPQAVVEQNVTMFPVLIKLPNPERLLKPGMNAEVSIRVADRAGVVAVPNGAVVSMRDAPSAGAVLGLEEQAVRASLAKLRQEREGRQGAGPAGGGGPGLDRGERGERAGGSRGDVRPGVVFVKGAKGPEPKMVLFGLSDWDNTEVVRGLEPGTEVYLISVARLQQQQEQFSNRMRERAGGGMFGSSGGGQRGGSGGGSQGGGGSRGN